MQHALLELHQMRQHLSRQLVTPPNQCRKPRQELRIPQSHQPIWVDHHSRVSREISSLTLPLKRRFQRKNSDERDRHRERAPSRILAPSTPLIQQTSLVGSPPRPNTVNHNQRPNRRIPKCGPNKSCAHPSLRRCHAHQVCTHHLRGRTTLTQASPSSHRLRGGDPKQPSSRDDSHAPRRLTLELHRWSRATTTPTSVSEIRQTCCVRPQQCWARNQRINANKRRGIRQHSQDPRTSCDEVRRETGGDR